MARDTIMIEYPEGTIAQLWSERSRTHILEETDGSNHIWPKSHGEGDEGGFIFGVLASHGTLVRVPAVWNKDPSVVKGRTNTQFRIGKTYEIVRD